MKKKVLAIAMSILVTLSLVPATAFADANVAEVDGQQYSTLSEAIKKAKDGSTVKLLDNVTENVTINKNVTVDGEKKYTVSGLTTINNGTVKNITLKPNPSNKNGALLTIGSGDDVSILLDNITVNYSVTNRSSGSAVTVSGNNADITINDCHFINEAKNNGNQSNVLEWSYGLFINEQGNNGSIKITNTEFNGAFRTMIPNASGKMLIDNCKFTNSIYSVLNGPTSGSGSEATTITTSNAANNNITVTNNIFNNAGAIYLQTQAKFENNHFIMDGIMHYIQARGSINEPIDFRKNTFDLGNNSLVAIDLPVAPVLLTAGLPAVDYWLWNDTPEKIKPADYSDYKYTYNEDGSITYMPQSDVALEQILTQSKGNKQVKKGDTILIEKNLKFPEMTIDKDRCFDIEVSDGITLDMPKNLEINSKIAIKGNGTVHIPKDSKITIADDALLDFNKGIRLLNYGNIDNDGNLIIPEGIQGDGSTSGDGKIENVHNMKHVEAVSPTCTANGNIEYWYCAFCDKYYLDEEGNNEVNKDALIIKKISHTYKDGVCTVCGHKESVDKPVVKPDSPQTGDNTDITMLLLLLISSILSASILTYKNNKL